MWCDSTPRTASVKPQLTPSSGTLNGSHVLVLPLRTSASACSTKCRAIAAEYAWKYVRARLRSSALLHCGIFHSKPTSGLVAVRGRVIVTLCPVDLTYGVSTSPASAVTHSRAIGPPPVSRARWSLPSNQRGDIVHEYLPSKSRFCGRGMVCWFHGWRWSTGLPSGSCVTNIGWSSQSS